MSACLMLLLFFCGHTGEASVWNYAEGGESVLPLRSKRDAPWADDDWLAALSTPKDGLILLNETGSNDTLVHDKDDHIYYTVTYHAPDEKNFNRFYHDVAELLKRNASAPGTLSHQQLEDSYRRAVNRELTFDFPFYGHKTRNFTIATGGFGYLGNYRHSWLAATQYIAPLMGNFDTSGPNATIRFVDTGELFVIEWVDVNLRSQKEAGSFTFQLSLHKNGSIWFVYKEIPMEVHRISDAHHPRKVGLSDAYLHLEHNGLYNGAFSKRVIYEYHRVEIDLNKVRSLAVIEINPNPENIPGCITCSLEEGGVWVGRCLVCVALNTCEACVGAQLRHFNCSWCASYDDAFCSDSLGYNRRRQDFFRLNCQHQSSMVYCAKEEAGRAGTRRSGGRGKRPSADRYAHYANSPKAADRRQHRLDAAASKTESGGGAKSFGGGAVVAVMLIVAMVLLVGGWVFYAYNNPQSPSGQLLIRYRPSRWRLPGDHGGVRYTASVHM